MKQFEPNERHALETAAIQAGFRLEPSAYDCLAMIENAKHRTPEELLSGEPIMFGRFAIGGKLEYCSVSFAERDGHELAQARDKDGRVIAEYRAQIMVLARRPGASSPFVVIAFRHCWLKVELVDGCLLASGGCGTASWSWSSCDYF